MTNRKDLSQHTFELRVSSFIRHSALVIRH